MRKGIAVISQPAAFVQIGEVALPARTIALGRESRPAMGSWVRSSTSDRATTGQRQPELIACLYPAGDARLVLVPHLVACGREAAEGGRCGVLEPDPGDEIGLDFLYVGVPAPFLRSCGDRRREAPP